MPPEKSGALEHVVVVLFENRSLDNVLGHLYGPNDGKVFEGVIGKDLSNPIPSWAEHGVERKVVPYTVATDMDAPNPDSGEEYFHTNTQLFNTLDDHNRSKIGEAVTAPWNAPGPGARDRGHAAAGAQRSRRAADTRARRPVPPRHRAPPVPAARKRRRMISHDMTTRGGDR